MNRIFVYICMALVFVLAAGVLLMQLVILPSYAAEMAAYFPEVAYLHYPFLVAFQVILGLFDVILFALWMLLTKVAIGSIFSASAFRYVDLIVVCFSVSAVILAVILGIMLFGIRAGGPGVVFGLMGGIAGATFAAVVMLVMRGLLTKATQNETYLAEVV
ncbi:MAG: DUF2975 domain-containing protein [Microbacteriaceae bacterium]